MKIGIKLITKQKRTLMIKSIEQSKKEKRIARTLLLNVISAKETKEKI